jgi:hypothetical protein
MDKPNTFGLKLSELRPCDNCGQKLVPFFQHIQIRHAIFNANNVNATLGLVHMWGGKGLGIAEAMSPGGDTAVEVLDESEATRTLFICNDCFTEPLNFAVLAEKLAAREAGNG